MAADDLYALIPPPALTPDELGVSPLPPPPVPPAAPQIATPGNPTHERIGGLAALIAALALGPSRGGTGILHGVVTGRERQRAHEEEQTRLQAQYAQQDYLRQQQAYAQQAQHHEALSNAKGLQLKSALISLGAELAKAKSKDEADATLTAYGNGLTAMGYRGYDANSLRIKGYRYVAPTQEARASKTLDAILDNPLTAAALKSDPAKVIAGSVDFDANEDGVAESFTLRELSAMAGRPMVKDEQGQAIIPSKEDGKIGSAFDETLKAALAQFAAENHGAPTPAERRRIVKQAVIDSKESPTTIRINAQGQNGTADIDDQAQMLVDGDLLPSMMSKRAGTFNAILARARRKSIEQTGTPLNFVKMQLDYEAAKRFIGSMNSNQMVRFQGLAKSVVNTINEVRRLGEDLKQGGVQLFNRARRGSIQQLYGNTPQSEAAAQYLGAVNILKEEFASLVQGGYSPTEPAFQLANQQINQDFGVKDLNASLTEVQRLITYRLNAFDELQPRGVAPPAARDPAATARENLLKRQPR